MWCGCDAPERAVAVVEETLREQASTEPKTGVLRALEVGQTARVIAAAVASSRDPACELRLPEDGSFSYRWTLELIRRTAAGIEGQWKEERELRRDAHGNLGLVMGADFVTELGLPGRRSASWLLVDGTSYLSADGRAFYRRTPLSRERERMIEVASTTVQSLLDAVSTGWSRTKGEGGVRFRAGGEHLVCGPSATREQGWLRRFATRATPVSGTLETSGERAAVHGAVGSRNLQARWQLEDGSTLEAHFGDELEAGAAAVEAPNGEAVVRVERDRSLERVEQLISEMARDGLIAASSPPSSDTKEDRP